MTSWNGRSSPDTGSAATISPSRITSRGPSPAVEQLDHVRELARDPFQPAGEQLDPPVGGPVGLDRTPSYLYSAPQDPPSLASSSAASLIRWASMARTGLPGRTCIAATASRPPWTRVAATRPRSEQML